MEPETVVGGIIRGDEIYYGGDAPPWRVVPNLEFYYYPIPLSPSRGCKTEGNYHWTVTLPRRGDYYGRIWFVGKNLIRARLRWGETGLDDLDAVTIGRSTREGDWQLLPWTYTRSPGWLSSEKVTVLDLYSSPFHSTDTYLMVEHIRSDPLISLPPPFRTVRTVYSRLTPGRHKISLPSCARRMTWYLSTPSLLRASLREGGITLIEGTGQHWNTLHQLYGEEGGDPHWGPFTWLWDLYGEGTSCSDLVLHLQIGSGGGDLVVYTTVQY